ncbi:helix-turn-helix domain-containing protein [Micromonospora sp. AMSO31t]|uniref:helix-turn-helix domain-containing protein n=1 Tax=Micromonospora sp. AMSO31t TaxID=2650566 RepID=UPI00124BAD4C|nr:helix-turn-helix transcriptional regulator [Micromonospora sp. AMSO31t]KAB1914877.1 helix-turn-helix transcriptional regulator [Micromonospora sp. AMSO31t]
MVLLRRVIGDALRARRQGQHRTLREVSSAANVSLGYLSEIERGQKEPSSELLAAICDALGARLSELLSEVSDTVALAEQMPGVLVPVADESIEPTPAVRKATNRGVRQVSSDGSVAVQVRQDSPLKATLRTTRVRPADRDVVCAA